MNTTLEAQVKQAVEQMATSEHGVRTSNICHHFKFAHDPKLVRAAVKRCLNAGTLVATSAVHVHLPGARSTAAHRRHKARVKFVKLSIDDERKRNPQLDAVLPADVEVRNLFRVENADLKDRFQEFLTEHDVAPAEHLLAHGSSVSRVRQICEEGWKLQHALPSGICGAGVYLSTSFAEANSYAHDRNRAETSPSKRGTSVVLAQHAATSSIMAGECETRHATGVRARKRPGSVVHTGTIRVFFHEAQLLPTYLVQVKSNG